MKRYSRECLLSVLPRPDNLPTPKRRSSTPDCLHQYSGSRHRHLNTIADEYNTPQNHWHGRYLSQPSRHPQPYTANRESQTPPPIQSDVPYVHANETLIESAEVFGFRDLP